MRPSYNVRRHCCITAHASHESSVLFYSSVNGQKFGSVPSCYSIDAMKKEVSCPNKNVTKEFRSSFYSVNGVYVSEFNNDKVYSGAMKWQVCR